VELVFYFINLCLFIFTFRLVFNFNFFEPLYFIEIGLLLSSIDGVGQVICLDYSFIGELIYLTQVRSLTLNLDFILTGLSILGNDVDVEQGDLAERSFTELIIEIGFFLVGRVIDPAANYLD
jgi:F0F1-type ATP synthase alpha subunit